MGERGTGSGRLSPPCPPHLLVYSLHFTHSLHFTTGPQSAVRSLRFTLTELILSRVKKKKNPLETLREQHNLIHFVQFCHFLGSKEITSKRQNLWTTYCHMTPIAHEGLHRTKHVQRIKHEITVNTKNSNSISLQNKKGHS